MTQDPDIQARVDEMGYTLAFLGREDFKNLVVEELEQWRTVAEQDAVSLED